MVKPDTRVCVTGTLKFHRRKKPHESLRIVDRAMGVFNEVHLWRNQLPHWPIYSADDFARARLWHASGTVGDVTISLRANTARKALVKLRYLLSEAQ